MQPRHSMDFSAVADPSHIDMTEYSELQLKRLQFVPPVPLVLASVSNITTEEGERTIARSASEDKALQAWFGRIYPQPVVNLRAGAAAAPEHAKKNLRVGIVYCGRQCPGANNVVAGLFDYLKGVDASNEVLGFIGGTRGLFEKACLTLTSDLLAPFRNQGGFHLLGRSVDKIRSPSDQAAALAAAEELQLDGLVLVGGTYTNSDAAHLAQYFAAHQRQGPNSRPTSVIGVPVTIDGDMCNQFVEATLGFDTATKVYSQLVGNMATDANSAKKYWYFIRLMGRAASNITLECALQTHPNVTLLGEEMEARKLTLTDIVRELADAVCTRAAAGKNFGVVLVPEGAIAYIPELRSLIAEMNTLFAEGVAGGDIPVRLTPWSQALLAYLPPLIREQLFLERESSGAVQLSQISTEKLLAELVGEELSRRKKVGAYSGKYATISHFFGYQARSSLPSNFDCAYGNALGMTAGALAAGGYNGYMATVRKLAEAVARWEPAGVPLTIMMAAPEPGAVSAVTAPPAAGGASSGKAAVAHSSSSPTHATPRPLIDSKPIDVNAGAFIALKKRSAVWVEEEQYSNPGPIQFRGPTADDITLTLSLESNDYMERINTLRSQLNDVMDIIRPGVSEALLDAATSGVGSLHHILELLKLRD